MSHQRVLLMQLLIGGLTLASLEVALRVRQWVKFGSAAPQINEFIQDPQTGLRIPRPGFKNKRIQINSLGFRGPEVPAVKPPRLIRLAFLGGSTTYCAEVRSNERTWPHLVTDRLKKTWPEVEFDYINAAVPGYTTAEMLTALKSRIDPFHPDVVIAYEATNDLSSDSRALAEKRGLRAPGQGGERLSQMANYSVLWNLAELNIAVSLRQRQAQSGKQRLTFEPEELAHPFRNRLRELTETARRHGRIVALVTFAPRIRRSQSAEERLRAANTSLFYMPYMSVDGLIVGFETYNRVIRETASEMRTLLIGNEDTIPGDAVHYNDSVHFTDAGAERMAERVADGLVQYEGMKTAVASRRSR